MMKRIIFTLSFFFTFFQSQANFDFIGPDSLCSVTIDTVQNGACFQAIASGTAPFTYLWSDSTFSNSTCINPISPNDILCVYVTDAEGCVATACTESNAPTCEVNINTDYDSTANAIILNANSTGSSPYQYIWSTGEFSNSIVVTASGEYCVSISDNEGCVNYDCAIINLIANPDCNVDLAMVSSPNMPNESCMQAFPTGTSPFTYEWFTLENVTSTTSSLCGLSQTDTVCVTMTDANGCVSTACEIFFADTTTVPECGVYISTTAAGDQLSAFATGDSSDMVSYLWSNGANTESISPTSSGQYCVTITNANGCTADACYNHTLINNTDINGFVVVDSGNVSVNTFIVYLIENDADAGTLTAIDSVIITATPNNFGIVPFTFSNLLDGTYLVKAAIQEGSDDYDDYLPTYYSSSLFWDEASSISVPNSLNSYYYIDMIQGNNPGGPGFIGGLISEGANLTSGQVETRGEGDPLANVNILLLNDNDDPIMHTLSNELGQFEFPSLAYGTYKVVAEILGKEQGLMMVTLSTDNPSGSVDFTVNETFVTNIEDVLNGESLKVFPNPVAKTTNVQIEVRQNINLNISVINLLGKKIISENKQLNEGIQTMKISLENLPTGIYFLNLSDGRSIISRKILKK